MENDYTQNFTEKHSLSTGQKIILWLLGLLLAASVGLWGALKIAFCGPSPMYAQRLGDSWKGTRYQRVAEYFGWTDQTEITGEDIAEGENDI